MHLSRDGYTGEIALLPVAGALRALLDSLNGELDSLADAVQGGADGRRHGPGLSLLAPAKSHRRNLERLLLQSMNPKFFDATTRAFYAATPEGS